MYVLLTRKVPQRICEVVEKQLKVRGTYTMGFVWHGKHYGGLSILTKQDITPYKEMIEAIMNQASIAVNRIKSEQALRESEEKLRLFVEHAPASLGMFDRQMRYLAVSRRWLADYNLGDQNVIGRSHYDVFPEITERWKAFHRRGMAGEVILNDDDEFVRLDGSMQWLRWEIRPWYAADGAVGGIVIFTEDVTGWKQAQNALQESQAVLSAAESVAKIGSWKWDLNTQKVAWSAEMYHLFGVDRENFDGNLEQVINGRVHPDDVEAVNQSNLSVLQNHDPIPLEYRIVLPDGRERTVWAEGRLTYDQAGNPTALIGYVQDITERKQAEEALNESQAILAEAEAVANMGSWKWDIVTQKATWSEGVFKVLAVDPLMYVDNFAGLVDTIIHPEDKKMAYQAAHTMFMDHKPGAFECRIIPPDGRERSVWLEGRLTYDQNGRATAVIGYIQDITERKQAEKALRESEERYHRTLENMLEGCQIIGFDWRYLYLNASVVKHGRRRKEDLLGRTMMEVYPGIEDTELFTALRRCMAERTAQRLENKFQYENGSFSWFDLSIQPVPEGLFILSIDITEKKQAEDALRRSEERFSKAFNLSPAALSLTRRNGRIIDVNESYERLTGYSREELVNHDATDLNIFTLQQRADLRQRMAEQGGVLHKAELTARTKSGELRHIMYSVEMIEIDGDECALTLALDITERNQAEAIIAQLTRRMELILNSAGEGIYGTDVHGRITFANPALAHMMGWEPDELLGQNAHDVFHHTRADGTTYPHSECDIYRAMLDGRTCHVEDDLYWRKDRSQIAVEYISTPIREAGQIIGTVLVVKDITERKQTAQEQAMLEEQLRQAQKMESIGRLAGGVAHDFNNQLTIIRLYSDLIRSSMAKDNPLIPKLEQIRQATEHATRLTGQLLAFSRKQILQPVVLDLNDLVSNLQKMLARLIGEDITLSTVLEPGLWPVMADRGQIEQVIMNLIVNARDAMPKGGTLTIETGNLIVDEHITSTHLDMPLGPCVLLAVTDSGHGMDAATRKQIFEPFFTTKEKGKGTGLGLATVHGIVKQSGGAIYVYSEPGKGTTFKIYLPASENGTGPLVDKEAVWPVPHGHETILLVEDEAPLRDLVRVTLQEVGYTVLEAGNGQEALDLAGQQPQKIDLLLTDVVMPQMSGGELAEELTARRPDMKVLFMSGYMDDNVVRHGLLMAEMEFLSKPFTRSGLASRVRDVLDKA